MARVRNNTKWRPGDPLRPLEKFSEPDWDRIEPTLPSRAPANVREILETHGRALWDLRAGRVERSSARSLASALRRAEKRCSIVRWDAKAKLLSDWALEADQLVKQSAAYQRNRDLDRNKFYSAILLDYQRWGGDLGGSEKYVPQKVTRFFREVCNAVLGPEAPKPTSIPGVIRGRIKLASILPIRATSAVKALAKRRKGREKVTK